MTSNHFREFGEMVMRTIAARALVFIGDANEAMNILRRSVGELVLHADQSDREAFATMVGVSVRTLDEWVRAAREYEAERSSGGGGSRVESSAGRMFVATMTYLQEAGDEYRSLGRIVDHLKETLRVTWSTREVHRQLEAYVAMGILEHHPDDPEAYRLTVRHAEWHDTSPSRDYWKKFMELALPEAFWTAYKVFMNSPEGLGLISFFDVAETEAPQFKTKLAEELRGVKDRLDELEDALRPAVPNAAKTTYRVIVMAAPGEANTKLDETLRFVGKAESQKEGE